MEGSKLLLRCRAGDELAVEELVREYQPRLLRLALSILDDGSGFGNADAEEVAQDALMKALNSLDTYRGEAAVSTWLFAITVNICRNLLRARRRRERLRQVVQRILMLAEGDSRSIEAILDTHEKHTRLLQAVNSLDEKHRLPIVLRYYHDCSVREIAQILRVPEGTIHSRLNTARNILKKTVIHDLNEGIENE